MNHLNARTLLALVGLQLALVAVYMYVDFQGDATERQGVSYATTQWSKQMDREVGGFELENRRGKTRRIEPGGRTLMLHFWATWCPACRDEIPHLLALAKKSDIEVLAIPVSDEWHAIKNFFDGPIPETVLRSPGDALSKSFEVEDLPHTIVVGADGRAVERLVGPRDWDLEFERLEE